MHPKAEVSRYFYSLSIEIQARVLEVAKSSLQTASISDDGTKMCPFGIKNSCRPAGETVPATTAVAAPAAPTHPIAPTAPAPPPAPAPAPAHTPPPSVLTQAQLDSYYSNGFVVVQGLLAPTELQHLRSELDGLMERAPSTRGSTVDKAGNAVPGGAKHYNFTDPTTGDDPRTFNTTPVTPLQMPHPPPHPRCALPQNMCYVEPWGGGGGGDASPP